MKLLSRVRLFTTPWTAAYQAPPSTGFSRQECWSGVPWPSPHLAAQGAKWRHAFLVSIFVSTHDASSSLSTRGSYSSWQELDRVLAAEAAQQETASGPSLAEPADPCPQELPLVQTTHCPSHLQLRRNPSQLMRQLPRALAGSSQEAEVVEQRRGHTWS